jgi:hypothetical protein
VREEILYREALAVGLDRNDLVVRRRMVQKMELLTQDLASLADPTDDELRAFFAENVDDYRIPPRLSFHQVYFNVDRRGAAAERDARRLLAELRAREPTPRRAPERGDSSLLGRDYGPVTPDEVRRSFGGDFAETLFALEPGWHGPIASGYGLHLVHVDRRIPERLPPFEEIRERLIVDYDRWRGEEAKQRLYRSLEQRYEIVIDDASGPGEERLPGAGNQGSRQPVPGP